MKKFFLTLAVALVAMVSSVFAQNMQTYSWGNGVVFGILDGMNIDSNTSESFSASTDDEEFAMAIEPIEYQRIDGGKLGEVLSEIAFEDMGMSDDENDYEVKELQVKNGEGMAVLGQNADGTYCICAVFISKLRKVACFVFESFSDDYAEEAGMILGSVSFK